MVLLLVVVLVSPTSLKLVTMTPPPLEMGGDGGRGGLWGPSPPSLLADIAAVKSSTLMLPFQEMLNYFLKKKRNPIQFSLPTDDIPGLTID